MNEILAWGKAERLSFADLLESLDDHEWDVPSLCAGWTVRDVAAHLTLSTRTTFAGTGQLGPHDGRRRTAAAARFPPAELIAQMLMLATGRGVARVPLVTSSVAKVPLAAVARSCRGRCGSPAAGPRHPRCRPTAG